MQKNKFNLTKITSIIIFTALAIHLLALAYVFIVDFDGATKVLGGMF